MTEASEGKVSDQDEFLKTMRKRLNNAISYESKNRLAALEDLKFKNGDQWPDAVRSERTNDRRPCLTVNKTKTFVHQVTNAQRENRPGIHVSPTGDNSPQQGAEFRQGLIRAIERDSNADIAYDTAFESAVSNGFGYWRYLTEYETEESFNQVIRVKRIRNPMTVYLDPEHIEPDGSDARWAFITEKLSREDFTAQYPGADPLQLGMGGIGDDHKNWVDGNLIRIAEYFCYEYEEGELIMLDTGWIGLWSDLNEKVRDEIMSGGYEIIKRRKTDIPVLKWYKVTAKDILDERRWPGKYIPIVKVIGDEIDIEGKVSYSGIIRDAKDAQRMYNYWVTAETEMVALAPKAPFIMEEGQVEGHEASWKNANRTSRPYLLYKGTSIAGRPAPAPQRQPFSGPPTGIVQAKAGAAQDMMATTGIRFDGTLQERLMDESGKAISELRRSGDIGAYHYIDNLARSLKYGGAIMLDLIPKVYDTPRKATIVGEDDKEEMVHVDPGAARPYQERTNTQTGKTEKVFNPKMGNYGVTVTIGPSYATKRIEAANQIIEYLRIDPQAAPLIRDILARNMDWDGSQEIANRFAKTVPPDLLSINKDIPPQAQAVIRNLQNQLREAGVNIQNMTKALTEKQADRQLDWNKSLLDHDAKIKKLEEDFAKTAIQHPIQPGVDPAQLMKFLQDMFGEYQNMHNQLMAQQPQEATNAG